MSQVRVFEIPVENGNKIVYIPVLRTVRLVSAEVSTPSYLEVEVRSPSCSRFPIGRFLRSDLILNNICNLRCVYCYANSGTQPKREMQFEVARQAIERVITDCLAVNAPRFDVTLTGGGEPLLSFSLVQRIVEYCRSREKKVAIPCKLAIVSNGCFNPLAQRFVIENFSNISISIDGLPWIQNLQRPTRKSTPTFRVVARNIDALLASGKIGVGFRMTVTSRGVDHLLESVLYLHQRWPGILIGIEPLERTGRCLETGIAAPDMYKFIRNYIEVLRQARERGIQVRSSLATFKALDCGLSFCGVNGRIFGVDPEGNVTACTRVNSEEDALARHFYFGKITPDGTEPQIDVSRYQCLTSYVADEIPACSDCYARSNCKGDCCHYRATAVGSNFKTETSSRCEAIRLLTRSILRMELGLPPC